MTTTTLELDHENDEIACVIRWRLGALLRGGYSIDEARVLARRGDIDLHRAVELVRKGCPPALAYRILA